MQSIPLCHDLPTNIVVEGTLTCFINKDYFSKWRDHSFIEGSSFGHWCDIAMMYQFLDWNKLTCLVFVLLLVVVE